VRPCGPHAVGKLDGRSALITGGASGIGLATAGLFLEEGAAVTIADIDEPAARCAAAELKRLGRCHAVVGDVASMADGKRMVEEAIRVHGRLDILFCNAGIPARVPISELTEEQWDRTLAVNLKGMFTVIKAAVPHMKERGRGVIILTGSELSFVGDPETPAYSATKGAVLTLTRSLALDLIRYGIRVNAICPGTTMTPLIEKELQTAPDPEAIRQQLQSWGPISRVAEPSEQARGVLFLASDDASYAVGTALLLDGGFTAM
jgi:NAD(P)-dependent dehydrogenase (short-subunit alcohol dehydrogenase family)